MGEKKHIVVRAQDRQWVPGIFHNSTVQFLYKDANGRQTFLARFGPGGSIVHHDHPGRELAYVLEGEMRVGDDILGPGDFLTAGAGECHDVYTEHGVTFLVTIDAPIEECTNEAPKQ